MSDQLFHVSICRICCEEFHLSICTAQPVILPSEPIILTATNRKMIINCNIQEGSPPFKFEWMKDGSVLQSDENTKIKVDEEDSLLSIKSTRATDDGNYTCIVKNAFGSASFTTRVIIQGRSLSLTTELLERLK